MTFAQLYVPAGTASTHAPSWERSPTDPAANLFDFDDTPEVFWLIAKVPATTLVSAPDAYHIRATNPHGGVPRKTFSCKVAPRGYQVPSNYSYRSNLSLDRVLEAHKGVLPLPDYAAEFEPVSDFDLLGLLGPHPVSKSPSQAVLQELIDLDDGWAGPGTVPPPRRILDDVEDFLDSMHLADTPEISVDEVAGDVALRFELEDGRVLVFDFAGKGSVLATLIHPDASMSRAKALKPISRRQLLAFLDFVNVEGFA